MHPKIPYAFAIIGGLILPHMGQADLVLTPSDDGELRNNGSVLGTQSFANIKNSGAGSTVTRKAIYRFDLSSFVSGTADDASSIQFTVSSTTGYNYTSTNNELTLWGLNDGSTGESWDPSTITYDTAPGNDATSGSAMDEGTGDDQVANLGSFNWGPTVALNDSFTVSGTALATFLNADTDSQATFYLSRTGGDAGEPGQNFILGTVENSSTARRPTLNIVAIPEPTTAALLAVGGLAMALRRRKAV